MIVFTTVIESLTNTTSFASYVLLNYPQSASIAGVEFKLSFANV